MKALRSPILLASVVICGSAAAQTYKCAVDGKTVYQQAPCTGGSKVNTSGAGKADLSSPSAIQARQEMLGAQRQQVVDQAIRGRQLLVGMTAGEVVQSWGTPTKVNKTVTASKVHEQWIYRGAKIGEDQYAYIENGVLRSIQLAETSTPQSLPGFGKLAR